MANNHRACFKNDLYYFATQKDQTSNQKHNKKPKQNISHLPYENNSDSLIKKPPSNPFDFSFVTHKEEKPDKDLKQLDQLLKQLPKKQNVDKSQKIKPSFNIFSPKVTLELPPPKVQVQNEEKIQTKLQDWNQRKKIRDTLTTQLQHQKANQKEEQEVEKNSIKKSKMIKKQGNYVRLDLKKKYTDKFRGKLANNIRKFNRNGTLKEKYRPLRSQFTVQENGQLYNSYINSLSRALCITVSLQSGEQSEQEQQLLKYQIPEQFTKPNLEVLIKQIYGFESFRQGQYQTINNILHGKSTLFVSETASGKSLTYVLSSILLKGLSIVVSPLISLMLDQLAHLPKDLPAACISSLLNRQQRDRILKLVKNNQIQLLFLTPQCLQSDFACHIKQFPKVNFVCIDQAHCLSQLSHNFRTSYLVLQEMVMKYFSYKWDKPVILALTATANTQTVNSIKNKLKINQIIVNKNRLNKNLFITVSRQYSTGKYQALLKYLSHQYIRKCKGILIYARTRKILQEVSNYLQNSGMPVGKFHSGLSQRQKVDLMSDFRSGKQRIVVSTNALGMGLDFQNLQCIIHMNLSKGIQSYVQEIGRAGRRNTRAYCHLFLDNNDYFTERNYILADQLQSHQLKSIISEIEKATKTHHKNNKTYHQISNKQTLKRPQIEQIEQIFNEDEKSQQHSQVQSNLIKQDQTQQTFRKLSYIKVETLKQRTSLKQQTLLAILLKMQSETQGKLLKIHPLSYQSLKISFFKTNKEQLCSKNQFFNKLVNECKFSKGNYYIPLIQKCNELKMNPIQLLSNLYKISNEEYLRIELINDVYLWEYVGKIKFCELDYHKVEQNSQKGEEKQKLPFFLTIFKKIHNQINELQLTSLLKLNIFYSLAFLNSAISVGNLIERNQILSKNTPLPLHTITSEFDEYFSSGLKDYYEKITHQDDQIQSFIPITDFTEEDEKDLDACIKGFMKNCLSCIGQNDVRTIVDKYIDGRIISRVLLGVNDLEVNWKIYGDHSYWMKFKNKDHNQLLKEVKKGMKRYVKDQGIYLI